MSVLGWPPYYSDPNGLTGMVGDPGVDNSADDPVPALEGTFYLLYFVKERFA